ncbi:MAG: peptide chain release factor N(5)-glutamine methyltransferase [Pseudomonadota bacterium]|nr:peptide chain release factor N(5)-glutamine methyltransferase [Pseudomonadota bacterium]
MPTVSDALHWAEQQLAQVGPDSPAAAKVDSQWLLGHVLGRNSAWLRAWPDALVGEPQWQQFQALIQRRLNGEPVAYLTGQQGFWTLELQVTPETLVPRPDTERLVELALQKVGPEPARVLDLGTGTGAIALALASERPRWEITATDLEQPTLAVAQGNSERLNLPITLLQSHWFAALAGSRFDLIVSNPPYIAADDPHLLGPGVRSEPMRALVSGSDGLDAIREIVRQAPGHLDAGGWLLLEHGWHQGEVVRALLLGRGFTGVATERDLGGNERVTLGQWNPGSL